MNQHSSLPSEQIRKIVQEFQNKRPAQDAITYTAYCLEAILKYLDQQALKDAEKG